MKTQRINRKKFVMNLIARIRKEQRRQGNLSAFLARDPAEEADALIAALNEESK